tara:strand:+ start:38950 stop:39786 length:837 start_codon:yes stop_codon:yes gene_type:complete
MGQALTEFKAKLAAKGAEAAGDERVSSSFISLKSGVLSVNDEALPGNEMLAVVLDSIHENTYYGSDYDPDVILPPTCFSFGRTEKEMEPHENVPHFDDDNADTSFFKMQSEWCDECPMYEWGSADKGKGKACGSKRRLAIIPAGNFIPAKGRGEAEMEVFEGPAEYSGSDIVMLKLPVTSVKNWSKYVHQLNADHSMPPFAAITHIRVVPDAKTQFKVEFELLEIIEDEEVLQVLMGRHEEAVSIIEDPYTEPEDDETPSENKARSGIANLRKSSRGA